MTTQFIIVVYKLQLSLKFETKFPAEFRKQRLTSMKYEITNVLRTGLDATRFFLTECAKIASNFFQITLAWNIEH